MKHVLCHMQDVYHPRGEFKKTKVAMTIHNIAFQVVVFTSCTFCHPCGRQLMNGWVTAARGSQ